MPCQLTPSDKLDGQAETSISGFQERSDDEIRAWRAFCYFQLLKGCLENAIYSANGYGGLKPELHFCSNSRSGENTISNLILWRCRNSSRLLMHLLSLPHNQNKPVQKGLCSSSPKSLQLGKKKKGGRVSDSRDNTIMRANPVFRCSRDNTLTECSSYDCNLYGANFVFGKNPESCS